MKNNVREQGGDPTHFWQKYTTPNVPLNLCFRVPQGARKLLEIASLHVLFMEVSQSSERHCLLQSQALVPKLKEYKLCLQVHNLIQTMTWILLNTKSQFVQQIIAWFAKFGLFANCSCLMPLELGECLRWPNKPLLRRVLGSHAIPMVKTNQAS